jgi:hypothetical protein
MNRACLVPEAENRIHVSKQDRRLWLHRLTLS